MHPLCRGSTSSVAQYSNQASHPAPNMCASILFGAIVRRVAVELSIEDPNGDVVLLTLYNFPGLFLASAKALQAHFPVGVVMAIREPWMKLPIVSRLQNAIIRVDSPSDIIILEPSNVVARAVKWKTTPTIYRHVFTSAEQWKVQGNQLFKDAQFVPAALSWSRGLDL